jgi:hypothetical protein
MKDENGLYYYPFPDNKATRMYVREQDGTIYFRLWNAKDPHLWEEHGWLSHDVILRAAAIYNKKNFDPGHAYDIEVARALVREHGSKVSP